MRKTKKASNTQTAFTTFEKQFSKTGLNINLVLKICIDRDWKGFNASWLNNVNLSEYQEQPQQTIPESPRNAPVLLRKEYKGAK